MGFISQKIIEIYLIDKSLIPQAKIFQHSSYGTS